jgi:hypothetical protein
VAIFDTASAVLQSHAEVTNMATQQNRQSTAIEEVDQDQMRLALQKVSEENETSELEEAVVVLLNVAVPDFTCSICRQEVENHANGCLVLYLEEWLEKRYQ